MPFVNGVQTIEFVKITYKHLFKQKYYCIGFWLKHEKVIRRITVCKIDIQNKIELKMCDSKLKAYGNSRKIKLHKKGVVKQAQLINDKFIEFNL